MDTKQKTWIEVWTENYLGQSELAKKLVPKNTYTGQNYLPWAVAERCLFTLDPDATTEPVLNQEGGLVHTEKYTIPVRTQSGGEYDQWMLAHFIKIKVTFMGKEFVEYYPIQDNAYAPVRVWDQNILNKTMQRAKVRAIARATGIGWSLYESGDLQFEEDEKPGKNGKKPEVKVSGTPITPVQTTPSTPTTVTPSSTGQAPDVVPTTTNATTGDAGTWTTSDVKETGATRILAMVAQAEPAKVETAFAFMNKQLAKLSPDVLFTPDMTLEQAEIILSRVKNPAVVENSLRAQLGLTNA